MKILKKNIIESTLNGIDESMNVYQEWSDGEWLLHAPEYFIVVKIAENISKLYGKKYITLEDNVETILNIAKAKGSKSNVIRKNGRFDIVIWGRKGRPRVIIEVKNSVYRKSKIEEDIKRIKEVLQRKKSNSTIEFGLIAFYVSREYKTKKAKQRLEEKMNSLFKEIKEEHNDISFEMFFRGSEIIQDNTYAWASVVILMQNR